MDDRETVLAARDPEATPAADLASAPAPAPWPTVPPWRVGLRRGVLLALALLAVAALYRYRGELGPALRDLAWWAVLAAVVIALLAMVGGLAVWRLIMADLGYPLPWRAAARIFFLSQLGKYLPGSVWSIVTQIELSREHRIPRRSNVTVGVLAIAVSVAVGLGIASVALPFAGSGTVHRYWWVALIVPMMVTALHPAVLGRALNVGLRLIRRPPLPRTPSWPGLGLAAGAQAVVWLLLGLQLWLLLLGLGAPALESLPVAIGGYALAYTLGQLAVGMPAGAGVRETALVVALSTVVSAPQALLLALVSRAVLTACDLLMAGSQCLVGWRRR